MDTPRFPPLDPARMPPAQKAAHDAILQGPRGSLRGPFNALLRSPDLADRLQKVGEYIRFGSSLPRKLNELAILVTARHWTAQYEWHAHRIFAEQAGLAPAIAEAIAEGRRPETMDPDEALVHDLAAELLRTGGLSDASFAAATARFGEQGLIDLIGAIGYYGLVSLVLNVDRMPVPGGDPLRKLP